MKYKFYDTTEKKWLKGSKTPHGSYLIFRNGYVYRRTSDNVNRRYLAQKQ